MEIQRKLDFETFEDKLGGWSRYLKPIFESEQMFNLYQEFKNCKEKITPKSDDLFKCFKLCSPEKLKVVLIGQDSYPGVYKNGKFHATGLAFDNSNSPDGKLQPSLEYFWDGISKEYEFEFKKEADISFLAEQGGFLLANRSLNCKVNKIGSFMGKWDFFWEFFLSNVMISFPGVPIVLIGKDAQALKKYIFLLNNPVYCISHPSFAAKNRITWDTEGTFKKIDKYYSLHNGPEFMINWMKFEQTLPF